MLGVILMPRGVHLSDEKKKLIYTRYTLGEPTDDIAESMDLNIGTVRRIIREQRKKFEKEREQMARSGKVVKKDGNGGKLMALNSDGFEFTHVTPDGKSHKKKVNGHIAKVAEQQYDRWCEELDDECEFMRKVERRPESEDQPKAVCGHPSDPIEEIHPIEEVLGLGDVEPEPVPDIRVRPWREVAEERQKLIDELEGRIKELEERVNKRSGSDAVIADTVLSEPKLAHWFNNNGEFRVVCTDKPVYALWAKTETPRFFGLYTSMESALKKLDEMNEVAAFLGSDGAFEVEELVWRG